MSPGTVAAAESKATVPAGVNKSSLKWWTSGWRLCATSSNKLQHQTRCTRYDNIHPQQDVQIDNVRGEAGMAGMAGPGRCWKEWLVRHRGGESGVRLGGAEVVGEGYWCLW